MRSRYGSFRDGPDPLAARSTGAGMDELGRRILDGDSVADALRELLREGAAGREGLAELARRIRERRRALEKSGRMDGLLADLAEMLDRALEAERSALFPDPSDDARFAEALLDNLPADVGRAVRELSAYPWRSEEAAAIYEQMKSRLQRDVLDQQFADLTRSAGTPATPEERAALQAMLSDLNELLQAHARGEAGDAEYREFLGRHGQFFPNAPGTLDEFIDDLARRSAALQQLLEQMSPEDREALAAAMAQAMEDLGIGEQMAELSATLQQLRPEFGQSRGRALRGQQPLGLPDATAALAELADLEALDAQLGDAMADLDLDAIDEAALERALGRGARDQLQQLQELQSRLIEEGYLVGEGDRLRLSPKAVRRIGRTALRTVFESLDGADRGGHQMRRSGPAGESTGADRPWEFGEEQPLDVVRTLQSASRRRLMTGGPPLDSSDFVVSETETVTRAAVALLVDQSFSMVMNDTWSAAKTMALALHSLATSAFPLDAFQVIAFANLARVVDPLEIPDLEASHIQGTNLQHALMLAGRFLDRQPGAQRIVMVVTDGEPTAHLTEGGDWWFDWPPSPDTIAETVAQVDRMTKRQVPITWFRLGDEPRLARFLDAMARRNGGRVLAPDARRLGEYVITDYVRTRTSRSR